MDDKIKFKNPVEDIVITNGDDIEDAVKVIRKKWKLGKTLYTTYPPIGKQGYQNI